MDLRDDWPLVAFTLLFPTSVFVYLASLLLPTELEIMRPTGFALAWAMGAAALLLTFFHLGRPLRAHRAPRNFRRSWLAREAGLASSYVILLFLHVFEPLVTPGFSASATLNLVTAIIGLSALVASVHAYRLPGRPGWRVSFTMLRFASSGLTLTLLLGLMFLSTAILDLAEVLPELPNWLRWGSLGMGAWVVLDAGLHALGVRRQPLLPDAGRVLVGASHEPLRKVRTGAYFAAFTLLLLAAAALHWPDTLVFMFAVVSQAIAAWFYRLGFFARGFPLDVPRLVGQERMRRLRLAGANGAEHGLADTPDVVPAPERG